MPRSARFGSSLLKGAPARCRPDWNLGQGNRPAAQRAQAHAAESRRSIAYTWYQCNKSGWGWKHSSMGQRQHAGSLLYLLCGILSLCVSDITATPLPKRNRLRRERLLKPEFGNSLSLLRSTFLPQGEVANRISGNEWKRAFGGITGRPVNPFLPDRRDTILTSKTVAALGAGLAAVAGLSIDNDRNTDSHQHPNSKQAKAPQSQCSKAAEQLFKTLDHALNTSVSPAQQGNSEKQSWNASRNSSSSSSSNGSGFLAQSGYIDFGLTDSQDSQAPCHPNCAFSNPSVAYGLTVLPLNPRENITAKVTNDKTPGYVKDNLDGRYGDRMAPVWQLNQDEVIVLAGCTPPGEASRYFGVTGYIYSSYIADSDQWINVFASLGDSASITTISDAAAAAAAAAGSAHNQQQQQQQQHSDKGSAAPGFRISSGRLRTSTPVSNNRSSNRTGSSFSSDKCSSSSSSSFGALTVVLMGANPTTVDAAAATIRNSIAAAANTHTSSSKGPGLHPLCPDYINIVPIPGPGFSDAIGLNPTSSYYTLVARNMAPSGDKGASAFQAYVEHPHLKAWRLTPVARSSSSNSGSGSKGEIADRDAKTAFTINSSSSSSGHDVSGSSDKRQQRSAMPIVTAAAAAAVDAADDYDDYEADSSAAPAAAVRSNAESVGDLKSNSSSSSSNRSSSSSSNSTRTTTSSSGGSGTGSHSFGLPYVIPRRSYDRAGISFIMNGTSGSSSSSDSAAAEGAAASAATRADGIWRGTIPDRDTAAIPSSSSSSSSSSSNITSHTSSSVNGSMPITGLTACTSALPSNASSGPSCSIHHKLAAAVAVGVSRAINTLLVAQPAVAQSLRNDIINAAQTESGTDTEEAAGGDNAEDQSAMNGSTPQGSRQETNTSSTASDLVRLSNSSSNSSSSNTTHNLSRIAASGSRSEITAAARSSDQRSATEDLSDHQKNATATWRQQQQQRVGPTLLQQQQMLDQLLTAVDIHYNSSYAIAFGMGSAGSLALLGVDWGLHCVEQTLDWCNGDNRDATYLSSLPLFTLNRPGQLLVVVGVNYVTAGVGSYMNIAVTDPIQQLGLEAFDDVELAAAAVPWPAAAAAAGVNGSTADPGVPSHNVAAGLSQQVLQKLMYVVAFSRNCTGVDLPCKELQPSNHQRNIPITRPLMTISRVYVNPATGVGPDPHDLIPFVTLLLTPKAVAVPGDYVPRMNMSVWQTFEGREGHDEERSSVPAVAALQRRNSSRGSNVSSSSTSTSLVPAPLSGSSSAPASGILSTGWLRRRPRLARWLDANVSTTSDRLRQQRSGLSPPRATRRWTNSSGDFDPLAAAEATRCPDHGMGTLDKPLAAINPSEDTDPSNDRWTNAVLAFDQMMAFNRTALRLIAASAHGVDSNSTEVVTAAQAAIDPCVRSLVGMSQCGGRGSPDVCCRFVQAWNDHDCWCEASGQVLLSTMPAVLTPTLLQLLSWVCEAQ